MHCICATVTDLCVYFKASAGGDKPQYLLQFSPSASPALWYPAMCCACMGMYLRISKALLSQSFIESSSWLRVFLKNMFILSSLLFLVSEYCASRKKSLNCWSRAFFQSLPRIKWLNKKEHRFYSLGGGGEGNKSFRMRLETSLGAVDIFWKCKDRSIWGSNMELTSCKLGQL